MVMNRLIYLIAISLLLVSISFCKDYTPGSVILSYSIRTPKVDIDNVPLDYEYSTTLINKFYYLKIDYERESYKNGKTKHFFEYEGKAIKPAKKSGGGKGKNKEKKPVRWYRQIGYEYKTINKRVRYSKADIYYPFDNNRIGIAVLYENKRLYPALHYSIKNKDYTLSSETDGTNWWLSVDYEHRISTRLDRINLVPIIKFEKTPIDTFIQCKLAIEVKIK